MFCSNCGKEISDNSKVCSFCGKVFNKKNPFKIGCLIILGLFVAYVLFGLLVAILLPNSIQNEILKEYELSKSSGNQTKVCMSAMYIEKSYSRSNKKEEFNKWQQIANSDCSKLPELRQNIGQLIASYNSAQENDDKNATCQSARKILYYYMRLNNLKEFNEWSDLVDSSCYKSQE